MKSWRNARFDEIFDRVDRKFLIDDATEYKCVGVRWYGMGAFVREHLLGAEILRKQQWILRSGDIVYNKLFAWKGAFAIADESVDGCIVSDKFPTYRADPEQVDDQWIRYYFRMPKVAQQAEALSKGAAAISKLTLNPPQFWDLTIPLPPLPEQRQIVARIEELAAKINEARGLRQQAIWEGQAVAGAVAKKLFAQLPHRQALESFTEVRGGIQKGPHRAPGANPVRYLTVAHVQRDRILTNDPRYFEVTPTELKRWRLLPGDVLIIEGNGSAEQIGRAALFRGEIEDCVHQNHVIRIRPECRKIMPEFLNCFLNSPAGQDEVQVQSRTTSGLRTLSVGRIKGIHVPVPPISEQRRIVAQLEVLQTQARVLEKLQTETATELDALVPSILDKAFKGEL